MISQITVPKLGTVSTPLTVVAGVSSVATAFPVGTSVVVRIQSSTDGYIKIGASNVGAATATDSHYIAAGSIYDIEQSGTHFTFLAATSNGNVYVSELN